MVAANYPKPALAEIAAKAEKAISKSNNFSNAAAVISGGVLVSPAFANGYQLAAVIAIAVAVAGVAIFKALQYGQRADALKAELKILSEHPNE